VHTRAARVALLVFIALNKPSSTWWNWKPCCCGTSGRPRARRPHGRKRFRWSPSRRRRGPLGSVRGVNCEGRAISSTTHISGAPSDRDPHRKNGLGGLLRWSSFRSQLPDTSVLWLKFSLGTSVDECALV